MEGIGRRADGRRVFTTEYKREQIARIQRSEITAAESARELQVQPGLIRHWKHLVTHGSDTAAARKAKSAFVYGRLRRLAQ